MKCHTNTKSYQKFKIVLIVPPLDVASSIIGTGLNVLSKINRYPSLGLGYIAGALLQAGYEIDYYDMNAEGTDYIAFKNYITRIAPDIVGITCNIGTYSTTKKIAHIIKVLSPTCKVILGGMILSDYSNDVMANRDFDIGVIGEGEKTIVELIRAIEQGRSFESISGIVFRDEDSLKWTSSRPIEDNIDAIPFPAWHLMPIHKYGSDTSSRKNKIIMISSRGCPYNCLFCIKNAKWRTRSPGNIVDEMEYLHNEHLIDEFYFIDSTFTVQKERVIAICKEIIKRKLKIVWQCETRLDCINPYMLHWMRMSGCIKILCGIESGDDRILKIIRKGITVKQIKQSIRWIKDARIEVFGSFIIGWPGDTLSSIRKTIQFARDLDLEYAYFGIATPGPCTDMMELALKNGYFKSDPWKSYIDGSNPYMPFPVLETREYNKDDLVKIVWHAYESFYIRFHYILKRIKLLKTFSELINNINGVKNLFLEFVFRIVRKNT